MNGLGLFLRGLAMGLSDIIPGISGATIALITGIYERFIAALQQGVHVLKDFFGWLLAGTEKKVLLQRLKTWEWKFLLTVLAGILIAIVLGARVMTWLLDIAEVYTLAVLIGLIAASAVMLWRRHLAASGWPLGLLGTAIGVLIALLAPLTVTDPSIAYVVLAGVLAISAMLLPGISGSYVLLLLGIYDAVLLAVHSFSSLLLPLLLGIVLGALITVRGIHWLLQHHRTPALQLLLGLVIGSLLAPGRRLLASYAGEPVILVLIAAVAGIGAVMLIRPA